MSLDVSDIPAFGSCRSTRVATDPMVLVHSKQLERAISLGVFVRIPRFSCCFVIVLILIMENAFVDSVIYRSNAASALIQCDFKSLRNILNARSDGAVRWFS